MKYEITDRSMNARFSIDCDFFRVSGPRLVPHYTFIWNQGEPFACKVDSLPLTVLSDTIITLNPGQVLADAHLTRDSVVIQFNKEFYCVQDHDHEVSCNGILFNGSLSVPVLHLDEDEKHSFQVLLEVMLMEFRQRDEMQLEMLKTVLKRFIIKCTRLAKRQFSGNLRSVDELDMVRHFSTLVEKHFRTLHRVSDYASLMNRSSKTLSNSFGALYHKSPLQIIHERIVLEGKKLLLYTDKSVKEIGYDLGFSDPALFGRLFRNLEGCTPGAFKKNGLMKSTVELA